MNKKKYLLLLLLLLLYALYGTMSAYAYEPQYTIDWIDIKNMAYTIYTDNGQNYTEYTETLNQTLEKNKNQIQPLIDLFNSSKAIIYQYNGTMYNQYMYFTFANNDSGYLYTYNGYVLAQGGYKTYRIRYFNMGSGGEFTLEGPYTNGSGLTMLGQGRYYCNSPLYSNGNNPPIFTKDGYTYNAGTNAQFKESGPFIRSTFNYIPNSQIQDIYIPGTEDQVKRIVFSGITPIELGYIYQTTNLKKASFKVFVYNKSQNHWDYFAEKPISYYGEEIQNTNDNSTTYKLRRKIDIITGSIIQIYLEPNNYDNFIDQYCNYYIGSDKDIIVNGTLSADTFSGDFYNNYQNQITNQNLINTIESGDNLMKELFDSMFTLESGDLQNYINDITDKINMPSGEIADMTLILDMLETNPQDFKISWTKSNHNFTYSNQPIQKGNGSIFNYMGDMIPSGEINFSQMERENQTFAQIMSYVRIILTISIGGILLRQFYLTILAILGVNVGIYGEETENKERLKRADEKAKREEERNQRNKYNQWLYEHRRPKK